jgi:4-aminobutyrate aminotransferase-like enzyme
MTETLAERRLRLMGPNVPTFYDPPLQAVSARGVWIRGADGRDYLDAYNNVPHVGHGHPRVVEAVARQMAELNIHSRYLHDAVLEALERLTATLGHGITQGMLVCTGSEANDVALRMAQAVTGRTGVIATDTTYHGNTTATAALSTRRPPIGGRPGHVKLVTAPDLLLAPSEERATAGARFAAAVETAIAELEAAGHGFSALILCPFFANEGLPDLPEGFLAPVQAVVRRAGGLVIADEVQPGLGRLGSHFWGHQRAGLVPDMVTAGKSLGNGYPVAAVLTRPDVMAAFRGAFGYFNTFGGTPVAAAAVLATLDVLRDEGLQDRAAGTGVAFLAGLRGLRHGAIASVRGAGLALGVELAPCGDPEAGGGLAVQVVEEMRNEGVLIHRIGRHGHVLKIRPPLPFGPTEAEILLAALSRCLVRLPEGS